MTEPAPAFRVKRVVAGILLRGDQILCCQRSKSDPFPLKWEFPGGKIEPGETPEQALARELDEELAIHAQVGSLVETIRHSYAPGSIVELHFFKVEKWNGEIRNRIFNDLRWLQRSELTSLDFLEADLGLVREIAAGKPL